MKYCLCSLFLYSKDTQNITSFLFPFGRKINFLLGTLCFLKHRRYTYQSFQMAQGLFAIELYHFLHFFIIVSYQGTLTCMDGTGTGFL